MPTLFDKSPHPIKKSFLGIFEKLKDKNSKPPTKNFGVASGHSRCGGKRKFYGFLKYSGYVVGVLLVLAIIVMARVPFKLKTAYNQAILGKDNLENAVYLASKEENFSLSSTMASAAKENFYLAAMDLSDAGSNFLVSKISFLKTQIDDAQNLVWAAESLSSVAEKGTRLGADLENLLEGNKKLSFSKFTIDEKKRMLKFLNDSSYSFEEIKSDLEKASFNLGNLKYNGFLNSFKEDIVKMQIKVEDGKKLISKALPMLKIMPGLLGYPGKMNYLIALQNNDELRPTGGFLGTFSVMGVEYGEIVECKTNDIYHIDMPVKDIMQVEPPAPLKRYLGANKWFMRDSNWSPDWPTSAKRIEWFYKNELTLNANDAGKAPLALSGSDSRVLGETVRGGEIFSGVMAITPKVVTDLLAITGPVYIENVEYNKDNFVDILQYRVEKGYIQLGIPSWQRKDIISEIYKELKIKLFDFPMEKWNFVVDVIDTNLREKNILLAVKDEKTQKLIREEGYAGEIKETGGDYFMVVDANMASLKTDGVMEKKIDYKLSEAGGKMVSKLRIDYINKGDFSWKTTRYRTYTRVYVPIGSKLIRTNGALGTVEEYDELGKRCFASFISVEPSKIGRLYFEYELPFYMSGGDGYQLYVQKQPGNDVEELGVVLDFDRGIKHYAPGNFDASSYISHMEWESDLKEDRVFTVGF